jgi:hypothetical protein
MTSLLLAAMMAIGIGSGQATAPDASKALIDAYLKVHAALAHDKIEDAKAPAAALAEAAKGLGTDGEALRAAAGKVAAAADLKAAREAFGPLSDELIKRANAEGWKAAPDAKIAYCPMAGRSWIQKGDTIANPYYGSAMLTCGEFKKRE